MGPSSCSGTTCVFFVVFHKEGVLFLAARPLFLSSFTDHGVWSHFPGNFFFHRRHAAPRLIAPAPPPRRGRALPGVALHAVLPPQSLHLYETKEKHHGGRDRRVAPLSSSFLPSFLRSSLSFVVFSLQPPPPPHHGSTFFVLLHAFLHAGGHTPRRRRLVRRPSPRSTTTIPR